ncbi:hypothetical protein BSKO_05235 [Bryopsis sp. KO-2023]|nr:hypothetical protein BSKO_05235 [Bryopsis sp. KO-2023]
MKLMENSAQNSQTEIGSGHRQLFGHSLEANFGTILDSIQKHDSHLLDDQERTFLKTYLHLSKPSKCLFLRLLMRKGPWFRTCSFAYEEVSDVESAVKELVGGRFCVRHEGVPMKEAWQGMLGLMCVRDLKELMGRMGLGCKNRKAGRKADMLVVVEKALSVRSAKGQSVLDLLTEITGPAIRLLPEAGTITDRFQRIYFLNESHSMTSFITADIGIVKWPEFCLSVKRPAFDSREALLDYELAVESAHRLEEAVESKDDAGMEAALQPAWKCIEEGGHKLVDWQSGAKTGQIDPPNPVKNRKPPVKPLFLARFCSAWVYVKMATVGVSLLEKNGRHEEAVDKLFCLLGGNCCPSRRGLWWDRLTTNLVSLNRPNEALEVCESSLADAWVRHGDRYSIQRRILRLGKPPRRWKKPVWASAVLREPPEVRIFANPLEGTIGKSKFIGLDGSRVNVEELALQHYARKDWGGWKGCHAENGFWNTLFGLLMWDVLFADIDDVFRTRFQNKPMDLSTDAFYPARQTIIETQLEKIRNGQAGDVLCSVWKANYGKNCSGVNWTRNSLSELMEIVECVGSGGLAGICELLAEDCQGWSGGLPDLLLWNPVSRVAKLSEVKGPNDQLSNQQRAWCVALRNAGLDVEVFKVLAKKKRKIEFIDLLE